MPIRSSPPVISARPGRGAHHSQGLLDSFTRRQLAPGNPAAAHSLLHSTTPSSYGTRMHCSGPAVVQYQNCCWVVSAAALCDVGGSGVVVVPVHAAMANARTAPRNDDFIVRSPARLGLRTGDAVAVPYHD